MIARPAMLLLAPALLASGAALAGDGLLGTLPHGRYLCELPGDAIGPASRPLTGAWFDVVNASSYASESGKGTYLRTGMAVTFTTGPMRGARFELASPKVLRRTNLEGPLAAMRCVRSGPAG